ncbi:hypothetical protein JAAARDRAFT_174418 [Jaapia argillacea MUCL 33604]|uniref:DUF7137 domain-containing protein n=1 Tax=Jaapia argillacea MUCL 33604 TaxID=933084 RepID=A0A067QCQ0_9AGAM|nr:hypothetical protein JAAARDRAFT_174418 [Jaapia argillacea MUCL 33604]
MSPSKPDFHRRQIQQQNPPATTSQGPASSQSASGSQSRSASSSSAIPQTAPAGGLTITQPPQTATSYYKLAPNNLITFAWNFTYLISTPAHLTVSAVCDNGNTYPVGPTNGIIPGAATSVVWDPYAYNQANLATPLVQGSYTLNIWDERGPGSAREPGKLAPNSALQFALYTPQGYTPIASGWQCGTCSSASLAAHPAFTAIIASFIVMFLSGYSILRHSLH